MAQVRIRKALQIKNRLAGEIANLGKLIQQNNSHRTGAAKFDVTELVKKRDEAVKKLIAVKTALAVANVAIYNKIATLAEIKNDITFLRSLNTEEGESEVGYGPSAKTYVNVAEINARQVEDAVTARTLELEKLQDEIDYFNSTTEIVVPD